MIVIMLASKDREVPMEHRISKLEVHIDHIQNDIAEIKVDIRRLDVKFDGKFDKLQDALTQLALRTEKGFADLTRWGIGLYIMLVAGMATGFMWIIQRLPT